MTRDANHREAFWCQKSTKRKRKRKNVVKNEHLQKVCVCVCLVFSQCSRIKKKLSPLCIALALFFFYLLLLRVACDGFLVVVFCIGALVFVFVVLVFDALFFRCARAQTKRISLRSKINYKAFFTAATVSASNALISDNMASTLAALASCMTAETILSPLEST